MARRVQAAQNVLRSSVTRRFIKTKKGLINKVRFPNYKTEREPVYDSYIKSGFICVNGNWRYCQALISTSSRSSTEAKEARLFFDNPLLLCFRLLSVIEVCLGMAPFFSRRVKCYCLGTLNTFNSWCLSRDLKNNSWDAGDTGKELPWESDSILGWVLHFHRPILSTLHVAADSRSRPPSFTIERWWCGAASNGKCVSITSCSQLWLLSFGDSQILILLGNNSPLYCAATLLLSAVACVCVSVTLQRNESGLISSCFCLPDGEQTKNGFPSVWKSGSPLPVEHHFAASWAACWGLILSLFSRPPWHGLHGSQRTSASQLSFW